MSFFKKKAVIPAKPEVGALGSGNPENTDMDARLRTSGMTTQETFIHSY
jgi:hypothetical protein